MILSKQLCTLNQGRRLRDLGVRQQSLFAFLSWTTCPFFREGEVWRVFSHSMECAAFTSAELGLMLSMVDFFGESYVQADKWSFTWKEKLPGIIVGPFQTEAEARAEILITLLERKMVEVERINQVID